MRIVLYAFDHIEYTIQLAEALSRLEEVMLMLPQHKADWFVEILGDDLNMESYRQPRLRYPTNLLTLYGIIKKINSFNPDIVHLQGEHPWLNLTLPFLRRRYPLVITVHDVVLHVGDTKSRKIPSFVHKLSTRYADEIIVHGEKLKKQMMEKSNKLVNNVHVLPRGVNSIYKRFLKNEVREEDNLILFFGRIWEYKGLQYLIEAEPLITEKVPTAKIVIAGTGEDFRKYTRMMVHKEKFIVHNRLIPSSMVGQLFQKASVVVVPYIEASQSGIVPLAYAFKKPVVVTDVGSIPEVVDNGKTGYIVPPKDPEKLAEAIIDLLRDKEKRREMGENGYKKTEEELSWDNIAVKTIEVYKKALSDRCKSSH
ncbi:Alpha-maltose-1-phosphate synthase [subsurface metagenome]|nr:glycosyltransferase [Clostridia bacterium]